MPKRRKLLNSLSPGDKPKIKQEAKGEVWTARGRLQGALQDVLEPPQTETESDSGDESKQNGGESSPSRSRSVSPQRTSYVLKLFDRSVDLAQFDEDSPLYPVCRAWILNRPRILYKNIKRESTPTEEYESLPDPEGDTLPRTPALLPEQLAANKNNINLNYKECPPISRDRLLHAHVQRWSGVRDAWLRHSRREEARYAATQAALTRLHVPM